MKKIVLLLLIFQSVTLSAQVFVGGSGFCHVLGDPNGIINIQEQDSTSDCLMVYELLTKRMYEYHGDSIVGNRWQLVQEESVPIAEEIFEITTITDRVTLQNLPDTVKQVIRQGIEIKNYTYEDGEVIFPIRFYPPEKVQIFY